MLKLSIILIIIISSIVCSTVYADSNLIEIRGSGVALLNENTSKMYLSSFRIFLHNQTSIDSGYVLINTDHSVIITRLISNDWQFVYHKDGSFHAKGPVISRQKMSYDLVLDGNRILTSEAGSLWKISGEINGNGQSYLLEYLVSGKDPAGNIGFALTASITIPNGNSAQSNTGFFVPLNSEILRGTTVTWQNQDNLGHTIQSISDKGNVISIFNSPVLKTGETFSYKFNQPGVYHYYCSIHPWRIGVVTVS